MVTIFSAPKSFNDEHIARIQRNAIQSWIALGESVEVILLGDEPGLKKTADALRIPSIPVEARSSSGAPLISELFQLARQNAKNPTLCYVNADIILVDDLLPAVRAVREAFERFLIVGNRIDVEVESELPLTDMMNEDIRRLIQERGTLHPPMGSDYFIFTKGQFEGMPPFVLGRAGWDNWMMFKARHDGIPVIDATDEVTVVHQNHDYGHLPGGKPHYRHPESIYNIQIAGGYETMFRLRDADWVLSSRGLRTKRIAEWEWPRKIEADLIARFGAGVRSRIIRMLFHPRDSLTYLRSKLAGSRQANRNSEVSNHEGNA